ncbi:hypothetical protein D9757_013857 [Collybiopsis confluens]|uniref:Uncharacterized protein n=1 Tax=Collybiopsis confluens TaxID=2823264 RepID=A0A8H5FYE9_9AGAR|nr:hypothetical protein D9757_013857 [Collybiopsis confluens]
MSALHLPFLYADAISTSSACEHLQPLQTFRLLTEHDFMGSPDAMDYYWGLPKGTVNLFSELNQVSGDPGRYRKATLDETNRICSPPDLLAVILRLIKDNLFCGADRRRICFEAFPVKEYEYKIFPLAHDGPPCLSGTLPLSVYPFFAVTHAGVRFPFKIPPRDPVYARPIKSIFALLCSSVPEDFSGQKAPGGNSHNSSSNSESSSDSESFSGSPPSFDSEPSSHLGYPNYAGDERRIRLWIQGTDDSPPGDMLISDKGQNNRRHPDIVEL